jgi:ABC-type multidrug transport system ATPase subunit
VGYVEQFNTLLPILSVEEMLMYTCQLKRARQEPWDSKSAAVEVGGCCCSARDAVA